MSWDDFIVLFQRQICRFVDSQAFWIVWEDEEFIPCSAKAEQSFESGHNPLARRRKQFNGKRLSDVLFGV